MERFERTERLIGTAALKKLGESKVGLFGLGGVGSYVLEALARSGVGSFLLADYDVVEKSNINRQLLAFEQSIGQKKTDCAIDRVKQINPWASVVTYSYKITAKTADDTFFADFKSCDYIVDAIDMTLSKVFLIQTAEKFAIPIISSMGTGNKKDPTRFKIGDIFETSDCPLSRVMRKDLRQRGIKKLKVVYSTEKVDKKIRENNPPPATIAFVPATAGLLLAYEVINDLILQ